MSDEACRKAFDAFYDKVDITDQAFRDDVWVKYSPLMKAFYAAGLDAASKEGFGNMACSGPVARIVERLTASEQRIAILREALKQSLNFVMLPHQRESHEKLMGDCNRAASCIQEALARHEGTK